MPAALSDVTQLTCRDGEFRQMALTPLLPTAFLYVGGDTHFRIAGDLTMNAGFARTAERQAA
jgi:hypothetical protein